MRGRPCAERGRDFAAVRDGVGREAALAQVAVEQLRELALVFDGSAQAAALSLGRASAGRSAIRIRPLPSGEARAHKCPAMTFDHRARNWRRSTGEETLALLLQPTNTTKIH